MISQMYGEGGSPRAVYKNQFIELFNNGAGTIDLSNLMLIYAASGSSEWYKDVDLSGSLRPGQYYLIKLTYGQSVGAIDLPNSDATSQLDLNGNRVAIANNKVFWGPPLGRNPKIGVNLIELLQYIPPQPSGRGFAMFRAGGGCSGRDYPSGIASPRNSLSALNLCEVSDSANLSASVQTGASPVSPGSAALVAVTVLPASNPMSTGINVLGDLTDIGGSASQPFYDDGTHGDKMPCDYIYTFQVDVPGLTSAGAKRIPVSIRDAQARSATVAIPISVLSSSAGEKAQAIFPHIADGGGYKTVLLLVNGSDTATSATISFTSSLCIPLTLTIGGATGSIFNVPIQAHGTVKMTTSGGASQVSVGWAKVTTSPVVALSGNAVFQYFSGTNLYSEASVRAATQVTSAVFYADEDGGFHTGFAATNPGSLAATGTLTLRDTSGAVKGTYPLSIPPNQHTAKFLSELFPDAASGLAEIDLTAGSLSMTALRYHDSSVFSTVSVDMPAGSGTHGLFSPKGGVRARIISEINKANRTIDIAIYSFTSGEIRGALVSAKMRGVAIRIVADGSQSDVPGSEIAVLEGMGFSLKRLSGLLSGIMHDKYMIIDQRLLLTGSYNWSTSAEENNYENALFIEGSSVIQEFLEDFGRLWSK